MDMLFVIPLIGFLAYFIFANFTKYLENIEISKIKRAYYLLLLIWFLIVIYKYYDRIIALESTPLLGLPKEVWNFFMLGAAFLIFSLLWESLFLYPKSISEMTFGSVKFTYKDKKNIDLYTNVTDKALKNYRKICEAEHKVICAMKDYVFECMTSDMDPDFMYIKLMEKYNIYQEDKMVYCQFNTREGISEIQKCLQLSDSKFEEIIDKVYKNKYYIFKNNDRSCLITILEAGFSTWGFVVALTDTIILKEEYDVLGHIVKIFDLELDNLLKEDTINALNDTIAMLKKGKKR